MKIWAIAVNTFREAIRDKILYNLLFFALAIMVFSVSISNLTLGQRVKIMEDMGLASISIFGLLIAIFVGIQLVSKEIQRRTIYVLLSKPVSRYQFLLGKFAGLLLTIGVNVLVMTAVFAAILKAFAETPPDLPLLSAILLIFMELVLMTAVALFFSTFSTPMLSSMFTLGIYLLGHLSTDLKVYAAASKVAGVPQLAAAVYYLLPNLENFNIKTEVVYHLPVAPRFYLFALGYGVAYTAFLLVAAALVFRKRDFK
jgi:ABC-type transport system involved in multi-copper enzyme maturation permease subunit